MGAFLAEDAAVYEETFVTLVGVTGDVDLCSSLKLFCGDGVRGSGCDGAPANISSASSVEAPVEAPDEPLWVTFLGAFVGMLAFLVIWICLA